MREVDGLDICVLGLLYTKKFRLKPHLSLADSQDFRLDYRFWSQVTQAVLLYTEASTKLTVMQFKEEICMYVSTTAGKKEQLPIQQSPTLSRK